MEGMTLSSADSWFRSQHEDIDLISEDDFYLNAPESISRPVSLWDFCSSVLQKIAVYYYNTSLVYCFVSGCD